MSSPAIGAALHILAAAASESRGKWVIGGSAGLMLRGLPIAASPRDIDIYCDQEDVHHVYGQLISYAVDVPTYSETAIYRSCLSHYRIEQIEVELVGGFEIHTGDSAYYTEVKRMLLPNSNEMTLPGTAAAVPVVPLAHELLFNWLRCRMDRVATIADAIRKEPDAHVQVLERLLEANAIQPELKGQIYGCLNRAGERG